MFLHLTHLHQFLNNNKFKAIFYKDNNIFLPVGFKPAKDWKSMMARRTVSPETNEVEVSPNAGYK
jgi:hypothetical protein